jgi:hypothetical protein
MTRPEKAAGLLSWSAPRRDGRITGQATRWNSAPSSRPRKWSKAPCTIISDLEGIGVAQRGMTPRMCRPVWQELYAATDGEDIAFEWCRPDNSLGSRLANQIVRGAAKRK